MTPKKYFFALLGIMVILIAAGGYGYYMAVLEINVSKAAYAKTLSDQAAAQQQLDDTATLKNQYKRDILPIVSSINDALPRTKNQTEILSQLQTIASASGLSLTNVTLPSAVGLPGNTSQTIQSGNVLALPLSFQLQGTYAQLQAFLTKVENLNRFTNVTSLAISHDDKNNVTYSMTVNAYIKP
jgi:Tfp pilus assembly protein PilO